MPVIRNPDNTKNRSTPIHPNDVHWLGHAWNASTSSTASPRIPSRLGTWRELSAAIEALVPIAPMPDAAPGGISRPSLWASKPGDRVAVGAVQWRDREIAAGHGDRAVRFQRRRCRVIAAKDHRGRVAINGAPTMLVHERFRERRFRRQQRKVDLPGVELAFPSWCGADDLRELAGNRVAVEIGLAVDEDALFGPRIEDVAAPRELVEEPARKSGRSGCRDRTHGKHIGIERRRQHFRSEPEVIR